MARFHLPTIEEEQLKKWEERGIFRQILARNADKHRPRFVFFEGPPTANGRPGIHHLLTRAYKDVILRYRTMAGFRIDRKAGWDTHGLPVELEVEKELGFTRKQDIEEYGIAKFNAKCRESVWKYLDLWQKSTKRIGFWIDLDDPYITYRNDYVESLWWILQEVDKKGLLYEGYRVTPHCPRCVTSLSSHELAQGYKDTEDPSAFVKFPVTGGTRTFFLVWTTTPWTLSGNVALALGREALYVKARMENGETFILAKARLGVLEGAYEIEEEMTGDDLIGTAYEPLYPGAGLGKTGAKDFKAYSADFVSTEDGTGIVHIAPAFGEDDAALGRDEGLTTLFTVDSGGMVTSEAPGKGKFFKKADGDVLADLAERGLLYKKDRLTHSYPFCWRCATPILYYAKSSWYIRMSQLQGELMKRNADVRWVPEHIRDGRFGEWLREVKDWALSRERYWGTPLNVWRCEDCGKKDVVGSLEEMARRGRPQNAFFFQRHGEAETNVGNFISSWPEKKPFGLTETGRTQVAEAAKALKGKGIDLIFASDLARTKETAGIISAELGLEVTFDERLREIDVGELNGKTVPEYNAHFSDPLERFDKAPAGGESLREARRRMVGFFKDVDRRHEGKRILVVSHGDPMWLLMTGLLGLSDQATLDWPHYNAVGKFREFAVPRLPRGEDGAVDVHRPFIDEITLTCAECGREMRRVPDVIDVWFDSGAMPFAQWHYPFENSAKIDNDENYPADYIVEAIDQTRGWFYTLLAVAALLGKKEAPYRNVICLGHLLDAKGQKMSKSKGNTVDPFAVMDKYGADAVRFHFFTMNQPGETKRFDERDLEEVTKKTFLILWNVLTFSQMFPATSLGTGPVGDEAPKPTDELDLWILSELARLSSSVGAGLETYDVVGPAREIASFINDLSTWYVRRSRDRFKDPKSDADAAAPAVLRKVLSDLAHLMAPFTPFLADALYSALGGRMASVHLEEWPDATGRNETLEASMRDVRAAASLGLERRAVAAIPVRQALASATVRSSREFAPWMRAMLADELNVHEVRWEKAAEGLDRSRGAEGAAVELDTVLTPELKREGAARELVRLINSLRKESGLIIGDRIVLSAVTVSAFWKQVLDERGLEVMKDVLADELAREGGTAMKDLEVDGERISVGVRKIVTGI